MYMLIFACAFTVSLDVVLLVLVVFAFVWATSACACCVYVGSVCSFYLCTLLLIHYLCSLALLGGENCEVYS